MSCDVPREMHEYRHRLELELDAMERVTPVLTEDKVRLLGETQWWDAWFSAHKARCLECSKRPVVKFVTGLAVVR